MSPPVIIVILPSEKFNGILEWMPRHPSDEEKCRMGDVFVELIDLICVFANIA